jgi:CRISPR-associated protein Cas1
MRELANTLYAVTPGASLHLDGDAIRVVQSGRPGRHLLPLARIDHVVAFGGVTITDDLVRRLAVDGKTATWLTGSGRFLARASGSLHANPHLRLAQYRAHDDSTHRVELARAIVAGKLQNTRQLILRAARDQQAERARRLHVGADRIASHLRTLQTVDGLEPVLGVEGQAAREYVTRWADLIAAQSDIPPPARRVPRPATDAFNAALNFGYALLRIAALGALEGVGLDPHVGYLHGVRPGKPALALDPHGGIPCATRRPAGAHIGQPEAANVCLLPRASEWSGRTERRGATEVSRSLVGSATTRMATSSIPYTHTRGDAPAGPGPNSRTPHQR